MSYLFNDDKSKCELETLMGRIYPVGSIYMSTSAVSPAELFGGTWTKIENRFLLAAGSSYSAGSTGGEARHTLTVNEMPSHRHNINKARYGTYQWLSAGQGGTDAVRTDNYDAANTNTTHATGGGQAHNNMPPYLAVYVWQRTA